MSDFVSDLSSHTTQGVPVARRHRGPIHGDDCSIQVCPSLPWRQSEADRRRPLLNGPAGPKAPPGGRRSPPARQPCLWNPAGGGLPLWLAGTCRQWTIDAAITPYGDIAGSTSYTYYAIVSACLSWTVRWEYLKGNPALKQRAKDELPEPSAGETTDPQFWSPEEQQAFCRFVDRSA